MKTFLLLVVGMLSAGCMAKPIASKFTVRVVDAETGLPVTNAMVQTIFEHQYDPWGNKPNIADRRKEPVDQRGKITFDGKCIHGGSGGTAFAEGYYSGNEGQPSQKNVVLNRWEPWNPMIEIKMRPKKNPVAMYHREGHWDAFKVPAYDQPIGYDLEKQDFVSPHGKGSRADVFFEFKRSFENSHNFDVSCTMTFPNEHDGIQKCYFEEDLNSSFKWPYLAPTNHYESAMAWRSTRSNAKPAKHSFDDKVNYIFRVRTQTDEDGNIISACYGKVAGPFGLGWADRVNWVYWFNPVPNERSLEWNGVNLLTK